MTDEKTIKSTWDKNKILIAFIGFVGVIAAAIIGNTDKLFPVKKEVINSTLENERFDKTKKEEAVFENTDSIAISIYEKALKGKNWLSKIDSLSKAIELKKDDFRFFYERGKCWIMLDSFEKAISDLDISIKLNNRYAPSHNHRGLAKLGFCQGTDEDETMCWSAISDFKTAIDIFEKIEKDDEAAARAYYNLSGAYTEVRKYCKALDQMKLAYKSTSKDKKKKKLIYNEEIKKLENKCEN